ncbi:MAG: glycosyltransferase family 4 protein [Gemmatimonadales bacterium]
MTMGRATVCFLSGARYAVPLDPTTARKFELLGTLGEIHVIGFAAGAWPRRFDAGAHFYLLPALPGAGLRAVLFVVAGFLLALWIVLRRGASILIAQSPTHAMPAAAVKLTARALGRRTALVVESHGDFEESVLLYRQVRWPAVARLLQRVAARIVFGGADALRAISTSTAAQLQRWAPGIPQVRFPTWTDIRPFHDIQASRTADLLFAGALAPVKGVHVLLRAFARIAAEHPESQLLIIGPAANPEYVRSLQDEILRLGLDGRAVIRPAVGQAELALEMGRARVLVVPSLSEGLGRVAIEAMAAGTPVVASRVGGLPDVIQDGFTGFLVPPGDEDALSHHLDWMLDHPQEAEEMGRRGRSAAASLFSEGNYMRGYAALFELATAAMNRHSGTDRGASQVR